MPFFEMCNLKLYFAGRILAKTGKKASARLNQVLMACEKKEGFYFVTAGAAVTIVSRLITKGLLYISWPW
jgi:hypothetical protein